MTPNCKEHQHKKSFIENGKIIIIKKNKHSRGSASIAEGTHKHNDRSKNYSYETLKNCQNKSTFSRNFLKKLKMSPQIGDFRLFLKVITKMVTAEKVVFLLGIVEITITSSACY
jgi:hypothetical protein